MSETGLFTNTKWNWRSPSVDRQSVEKALGNGAAWSGNHMYRTSYNDMSKKVRIRNNRITEAKVSLKSITP